VTPGQSYTVTVGAGGAQASEQSPGNNGSNSVFGSLTSIGVAEGVLQVPPLPSELRTEAVVAVAVDMMYGWGLLEMAR